MSPSSPSWSSSSSLPDSNALLAIPDGPITDSFPSYSTSFIGGYPTFPCASTDLDLPKPTCGVCTAPIPLLAQVYCPPEDGENDRTLYVFACHRAKCQRKNGAVRAWRASRRNEAYVRDVQVKRAKREEEERRAREEARKNPFTMGANDGGALFGAGPGAGLFGSAASPFGQDKVAEESSPDLSTLSITPTSTTLAPPHPAYLPAQYITTIDEYLPPPEDVDMDDDDEDESAEQTAEWRDERFEQMLTKGIDPLFERFVRRLGDAEGARGQVLRYELGGVPLPYSVSSPLTNSIFPGLVAACKAQKSEDDDPSPASFYSPPKSLLPDCPKCKSKRVFEVQLVPALINILRPHMIDNGSVDPAPAPDANGANGENGEGKTNENGTNMSEAERKAELERIAKGEVDEGMEWGTILVYSCEGDCVGVSEEWVGVEWEGLIVGRQPVALAVDNE